MRKRGLLEIENNLMNDKKCIFIGSDLGPGILQKAKESLSDQFYMEGISEAHVLGMASGLSMDGHRVYVNTIATFFVKRSFEQLALDICCENLNVCIYGNGGGLVYGPLGHTHTCIDDFSILRSLPNLTILAPADEFEMAEFITQSRMHKGPIYIRLGKGGDKIVSNNQKIKIGKSNLYGEDSGKVLFITTGVMLQRALEARSILSNEGISSSVLHYSTVLPFDRAALLEKVDHFESVIVIEEHVEAGGIGSSVKEELFKASKIVKNFYHFNLGNDYIYEYGRQEELLDMLGVTSNKIIEKVKEFIE